MEYRSRKPTELEEEELDGLLLSGLGMVAMDKASLTEAGAFFGVAFVLFFSKDLKNGG